MLLEANNLKMSAPQQSELIPKEYRYTQVIFQIVPMTLNQEGPFRVEFIPQDQPPIHADFYVAADKSLLQTALEAR